MLIIVTGLPASGKTTLAKKVGKHFRMPCICKDELKEILFDKLGWSDREWSKKLGAATFPLIDYILEEELKNGRSLVVECNFKPEYDNPRFQEWQRRYDVTIVQLLCHADGPVLVQRFEARAQADRHPGHVDHTHLDEFREYILNTKNEALDVQGPVIVVDTNDFAAVDDAAIMVKIANTLTSQEVGVY